MNRISLTALALVMAMGCATNQRSIGQPSTVKGTLVTVRLSYSDNNYLFEIRGTDIRGVKLEELENVMKHYAARHPRTEYECLSETMLTATTTGEIERIFKSAGLTLRHFWVAVNFDTEATGPYGPGMVDIVHRTEQ